MTNYLVTGNLATPHQILLGKADVAQAKPNNSAYLDFIFPVKFNKLHGPRPISVLNFGPWSSKVSAMWVPCVSFCQVGPRCQVLRVGPK